MKNQRLAVYAALWLLVLLIGTTGCRRKRSDSQGSSGSEKPAVEATGAPVVTHAPTAASGGAGVPAPHPGEAFDPAGIKIAFDLFQRMKQRPPNDWQEMIEAKVIPAIPKRKDGQPLDFSEYTEFYVHRGGQPLKR